MQVPVKPVGKRVLRSLLAGMLALLGVVRVNLMSRANLMTSNVNEKPGFIFGRRSIRARSPST
jgi:hypothetical protein